MLALRPVLALVANSNPAVTVGMIVAPAIDRTIVPCPPQVAFARIVQFLQANAVHARVEARAGAIGATVSYETTFTLATERTVGVGTVSVRMTIVQTQPALVHIGALGVGPVSIGNVQDVGTVNVRIVEISLHAYTFKITMQLFM